MSNLEGSISYEFLGNYKSPCFHLSDSELVSRYIAGDNEALKALISKNWGIIMRTINKYRAYNIPFYDMIQEAIIGLIEATKHFNSNLGYKFSTFVESYIRKSLQDAVMENGFDFKLPDHSYLLIQKVRAYAKEYYDTYQMVPSPKEISQCFHIQEDTAQGILFSISGCRRLNEEISEETEMSEFVPLLDCSVEDIVIDKSLIEDMHALLNKAGLSPKQKFVIIHTYGFDNAEILNFAEMGRIFKTSTADANFAHATAIKKLRRCYLTNKMSSYTDNSDESLRRLSYYRDFYLQKGHNRVNIEVPEDYQRR